MWRQRLVDHDGDAAAEGGIARWLALTGGLGLDYVKREARTVEQQQAVLAALEFKCSVLWAQLDALYYAYVTPAHVSPGAFRPAEPR